MQARVTCIGIILDGNRRWARAREVPTLEGHRVGLRTTPHLAAYMFSTENWSRSEEEVGYLMQLFREGIKEELSELAKEGVRIRFVGQRDRFATDLQEAMTDIEKDTENNDRITFWACLSYGGRSEIVEAAKALCKSGEDVTEDNLERHLWTAQMPDPDIIIRTSGEKRLSGFLTWKGVYSELFFVDAHWPDFDETMLDEVLIEYAERERRMGK
jgi:undecaprenyl diphosphate synthase